MGTPAKNHELPLERDELVTLLRTLSHDLKSPMFSIDGFSELLMEDYSEVLDEEGREFVERIRNGVGQLKASLEGFSGVVKLLSRKPRNDQVDLAELLASVRDDFSDHAETRGLDIEIDEQLPVIEGDREMLAAVFHALVSNAIKYADPDSDDPRVTIRQVDGDDAIQIAVSDNGIGIAPEHQGQIFEPGIRLDRTKGPAAGCGLYLADRVARALGGWIRVDSTPKSGATFTVTLPRNSGQ